MPDIAVLVCTRNRGVKLRETLESITRSARNAAVPIEAIIVDNGSTDDTALVINKWATEQAFIVKTLVEPKPGLARSRNKGIKYVQAPLVCMTDDDCVMHIDYIEKVLLTFAKEEDAVIIGGRIELGDVNDLPITIKTSMEAETLDPNCFPGGFIMGANLVFSAKALARIGEFDTRFGAGAEFIAAEDTDFFVRAVNLGIPIRYNPSFAVDHYHGRRTLHQAINLSKGYNFGDGALYGKHFFSNPRIRQTILHDLRAALRDLYRANPQFGIKRYNQFKMRHRIRGMIAYYRHAKRVL